MQQWEQLALGWFFFCLLWLFFFFVLIFFALLLSPGNELFNFYSENKTAPDQRWMADKWPKSAAAPFMWYSKQLFGFGRARLFHTEGWPSCLETRFIIDSAKLMLKSSGPSNPSHHRPSQATKCVWEKIENKYETSKVCSRTVKDLFNFQRQYVTKVNKQRFKSPKLGFYVEV